MGQTKRAKRFSTLLGFMQQTSREQGSVQRRKVERPHLPDRVHLHCVEHLDRLFGRYPRQL